MPDAPRWYRPVAVLALLWNLLGCAAYLSDVTTDRADPANVPAAEQALYAVWPVWAVAGTALAVWLGAAGSLALLLRTRWALPLLVVSLAGVVLQDVAFLIHADLVSQVGAAVWVIQGVVLAVSIGLVLLARRAVARGWIR